MVEGSPEDFNQSSSGAQLGSMDVHQIASLLNQLSILQAQISKVGSSSILDPSSPYFIHPGESPGLPLISITLNANNYHSWSRSVLLALKSKNKLKFIDGSIKKPDPTDALFEAWERYNTFIVSWINLSLSSEISKSMIWNNKVASDLWKDLEHRYYQGDKFRVAELEEEMYQMRQGELTITTYFTKLKAIWEQLNEFRPIPNCVVCAKDCKCGLAKMRAYREESYTVRFLRGEQYLNVKSKIMLMNPIPDINTTFSLLAQQDRQFGNLDLIDSKILLNNARINYLDGSGNRGQGREENRGGQTNGRGRGRGTNMQYTFCEKMGHIVDTCYKKHGFPPHLRQRQQGNINQMMTAE
ncbi:uncharacterized protein LOC107607513 [Arachis ipaensis]|uniref:uncharacterized protein LOC107607513 n=1 Tax=Arachis ipaensis TaxID=130454 RepID=UPI0007AF3D7B|nr:uncharacterized protein LOC107607513 [Arachis ipaensis]